MGGQERRQKPRARQRFVMFFLETEFPEAETEGFNSQSKPYRRQGTASERLCSAYGSDWKRGSARDNPLGQVDCGATEARAV